MRSGEGSFDMSKEFTFDQRGIEGWQGDGR